LLGTTTEGAALADNLTVADSGNSGITIRSGAANYGSLYFSDGDAGGAGEYSGFVEYNHNGDYLGFGTGSTTRLRINSSGNVGIGTSSPQNNFHVSSTISTPAKIQSSGNNSVYVRLQNDDNEHGYLGYETKRIAIYASNTGGTGAERIAGFDIDGLKFGSDSAAANALDDYEEGSWTPTVTNGASAVTVDAGNCIYVKVGSLVTCHFEVYDLTSPNAGTLTFGGLPYAPDQEGAFPVMSNAVDFPTGRTMVTGYLNSTQWRVYALGDNVGWQALTGNNMGTNGSFIGVISYRST